MQLTRRNVIKTIAAVPLVIAARNVLAATGDSFALIKVNLDSHPFTLPELPYGYSALEPYINSKTLILHHKKHQGGSLDNLNKLIKDSALKEKSLEQIIIATANDREKKGIFNNAAQVWNHSFYWNSMKPAGGDRPAEKLLARIEKDFGSLENFKTKFVETGTAHFGSGWVWLIEKNGKLEIISTENADLPLIHAEKALLVSDIWEHAYYLDYQNRRGEYLKTFVEHLANWDFAEANMKA